MSTEEEPTLRDMVAQTLDARGVLPKIRAELRANVFLALKDTPNFKAIMHDNNEFKKCAQTENGSLILNLIREFLEFFSLDFTLSVFNPETCCNITYNELNRTQLLKSLALDEDTKLPLLYQILNSVRNGNIPNSNTNSPAGGLNTTYVKDNVSFENATVKDDKSAKESEEEHSTISTASVSEASNKDDHDSEKSESANENSNSGRCTPTNEKQDTSINLLVFTPVQQVRTVPKTEKKDTKDAIIKGSSTEDKEIGKLDKPKGSLSNGETKKNSLLNDLPPLSSTPSVSNRQQNINEIRQLLEKGLLNQEDISNNSQSSKSNKSKSCEKQKESSNHSEDNTVDDEDEISELLNSHASDGLLTEDDTLSKLSNYNTLDHVESV